MVRRWKAKTIDRIDAFEADLEAMHVKLLSYSNALDVGSPHYALVTELHACLVDTMKAVTGRDAPWVRHRYPGFMATLPKRSDG